MVSRSRLPLSTQTLTFCGALLRAHRKKIGSRWRCQSIGRIVLLAFAVLRHDQRLRRGPGYGQGLLGHRGQGLGRSHRGALRWRRYAERGGIPHRGPRRGRVGNREGRGSVRARRYR